MSWIPTIKLSTVPPELNKKAIPTGHENEDIWSKQSELQVEFLMNTIDAWMGFHDVKLTDNLNPSKRRQKKFILLRSLKRKSFRL
jgi:hypothetical protein